MFASNSAACCSGGLETIFGGIGEEIIDNVVCIDVDNAGVCQLFADGGELISENCVEMENCIVVRNGTAMLIEVIGSMGEKK